LRVDKVIAMKTMCFFWPTRYNSPTKIHDRLTNFTRLSPQVINKQHLWLEGNSDFRSKTAVKHVCILKLF